MIGQPLGDQPSHLELTAGRRRQARTLIVRLRWARLGIAMHILTNSFGILAALFGVLT